MTRPPGSTFGTGRPARLTKAIAVRTREQYQRDLERMHQKQRDLKAAFYDRNPHLVQEREQ